MEMLAFGPEPFVRGLDLAGIECVIASESETTLKRQFAELISRESLGILFIAKGTMKTLKDEVNTVRLEREFPVIVPLPAPTDTLEPESKVELLEEYLGINLG